MRNRFLIILLFIFIIQSGVIAQEVKKDTVPATKAEKKQEKKLYSVVQFLHETYLFVKQPVTWRGYDWLKVGIVASTAISFMPFDHGITNATKPHQKYYYSFPVEGGRIYGEWYSIGGVSAIFGLYGLIARNDAAKKITIELIQAGLYSETSTFFLKIAFGRARPLITDDPYTYKPFTVFDDHFHSFPSGHTTCAMALSTIMSRHANTLALKILAYVPVAFTVFSRIYQNKHWVSDVVPAAAIGYFTGNWVVDLHEGKRHRINVTSLYPPAFSISLDQGEKK